MSREPATRVVVIGAGPAGLTAAHRLVGHGIRPLVLEADPEYVGGISRTERYRGYHFDIGGHRFFSKSDEVEALWTEILPGDLLDRPRKSRIYYQGRFFSYPLKAVEALLTLGSVEAARCLASYLRARAFPNPEPANFEEWVVNQFGWRLYEIFFKHYTEKVWGTPCTEISADWAAQRIKGLSLWSVAMNALGAGRPGPAALRRRLTRLRRRLTGEAGGDPSEGRDPEVIKTLIERFRYPRRGPGMLWEAARDAVVDGGGELRMGRKVVGLSFARGRGWTVRHQGPDGEVEEARADHVICSAPLRETVLGLTPAPPPAVSDAARALGYRDFLTVALIVRERGAFDDNWIYIQDAHVKVGRIQNFKAWSPEMVPDPSTTCYGLEYFCFEGDDLWTATDEALVALARDDLARLGLLDPADFLDGHVVRQPKAYPVYDEAYAQHVEVIREALERDYPGLHPVGRNGMHRYNNQDHAMMTAMLTVENIVAGERLFDVWQVNQDAEYHEAGTYRPPSPFGRKQGPSSAGRESSEAASSQSSSSCARAAGSKRQ